MTSEIIKRLSGYFDTVKLNQGLGIVMVTKKEPTEGTTTEVLERLKELAPQAVVMNNYQLKNKTYVIEFWI